jgi:enoyl-[acyl-carrier-protein] reductase (NADH)
MASGECPHPPRFDCVEAEEIAKTVFLASDDASNIQGAKIFVDGGSTGSPAGAPIYRG